MFQRACTAAGVLVDNFWKGASRSYRGKRSDSTEWDYVVKFAWPSDKRQRERGVTGVAECFHHEQIAINGEGFWQQALNLICIHAKIL